MSDNRVMLAFSDGEQYRFYNHEIDRVFQLGRDADDVEEAWDLLLRYGKALERGEVAAEWIARERRD